MSNEILSILLPDFASHEMVYLMEAISSDEQQIKPNPKYVATSIRMYHGNTFTLPPMGRITQPVGIAQFPKDILPVPKSWVERNYNLIQYPEIPYGGHFTAMEAPVPFAKVLSEFIAKF